ncbi:MAG: hypothetical protein P8M30_04015 [Planctomycetaceae bacterium]|nr:hypothetical protein [Planctomycetaceae bacterium]MDG2388468.1 hypothetical protein [Planctomycetaceae bacterium]
MVTETAYFHCSTRTDEQHTLPAELLQQSFDLSILELDNLLLAFVDQPTEDGEHDGPRL